MEYFFVVDKKEKRYILTARNEESAKRILLENKIDLDYLYELKKDTFTEEGFLMIGR